MTTKSSEKIRTPVYFCRTCHAQVTSKGHLCSPIGTGKTVRCGYCGEILENFRHLCLSKNKKNSFVCGTCGRAAADASEVCNPIKI